MGMVVIQRYILVSKLKKINTEFLRFTGYLKSINTYKARYIVIFGLLQLSKLLTSCLTAVQKLIKYCEKV